MEVYRQVGELLKRFTTGKVPKAFKIIPALSNWEEVGRCRSTVSKPELKARPF